MIGSRDGALGSLFRGVDPVAVLLYLLIGGIGCLSILSSSYDAETSNFFSFNHFYMKQLVWVGVSIIAATFVLLTDGGSYHKYTYIIYAASMVLLIATLLFGRSINGARAWLDLGGFRIQPAEITKIATALALARVMSSYSFDVNRLADMGKVALTLFIPLSIMILQNDTGSGVVLASLILVLYREGLDNWLCIPLILMATLAILSFLISPLMLLILTILICVMSDMMLNRSWQAGITYLALVVMFTMILYFGLLIFGNGGISFYNSLLAVTLISLIFVVVYAYRKQLGTTVILMGMFFMSVLFLPATRFVFDSILQGYQQNRILSFFGIISDPLGVDYNVNQSKIAIGSGGLFGKGFLQGTQIRYGFVPERHTDFIFCSIGEEWGFLGSIILLGLFMLLIMKLIEMGERQEETFGRVYCYAIASILLFHLIVNIGMTLGLVPVMGIPLPFVSYGGSSFLAFTVMLFIAIKFDSMVAK